MTPEMFKNQSRVGVGGRKEHSLQFCSQISNTSNVLHKLYSLTTQLSVHVLLSLPSKSYYTLLVPLPTTIAGLTPFYIQDCYSWVLPPRSFTELLLPPPTGSQRTILWPQNSVDNSIIAWMVIF